MTTSLETSACDHQVVTSDAEPALVPELLVTDIRASLEFWCGLCLFDLDYDREDEGFARISLGRAQVMLEQVGIGRNWITAPLGRPLGRGINFQIAIPRLTPILSSLRHADYALFMEPETKWYQVAQGRVGVIQFLVADPDGYLIRFQRSLEQRFT